MNLPLGWRANAGTLSQTLEIDGHGLHTGRRVHVRILPATTGGIVFRRVHKGRTLTELSVNPALRLAQPLCTALQNTDGIKVRTVEHLLASLVTCEIDHATVELDAEEVPILDGSALPWINAIQQSGRMALPLPKRFIRVLRAVKIEDGVGIKNARHLRIEPADHFEISVQNDIRGFGDLHWQGVITPTSFAQEIAPSRSYGRAKWAIVAIAAGVLRGIPILRGARPSCTATIVGNRVLGGLRMPGEFVRHRVLDLVGDLAMAGAPLLAKVTAVRPSHEMNHRLLTALLAAPDAWEWSEYQDGCGKGEKK